MNCHAPRRVFRLWSSMFAVLLLVSPLSRNAAFAEQPVATGSITGRVYNVAADLFLINASVSIKETGATALTDQYGSFRINNVPAGPVTIRVFYTGLAPIEETINVSPGAAVQRDFNFRNASQDKLETVALGKYVVTAERETDGAAIALNEQRFSPNIKNVLATSEVGDIPDANIAEFVKMIPGVTVASGQLQMRGFPSSATEITTDGNPVASAAQSGETRTVILDHLILNNVSRVEVTKVPTPDTPASSIGGKVNLISKSAFERTRPELTYRAFFSWTNEDKFTFSKTPGPINPTSKLRPGLDLSWIVPVNKRFGFSATYTHMEQSQPQGLVTEEWVPNSGLTTTQKQTTADNPYLRLYTTRDSARITKRDSIGLTFDFKVTPSDVLSIGAWYTHRDLQGEFHDLRFTVGDPVVSFGPTFTNGPIARGSVQNVWTQNSTVGQTLQPSFVFRHTGQTWKFDAAGSYSRASDAIPYIEDSKTFNSGTAQISNVTVNLSEINGMSAKAAVTNAAGASVNYYDLNSYTFSSATENPRKSSDEILNLRSGIEKELGLVIPVSIKLGGDLKRNIRDIEKRGSRSLNYVGPDGRAKSGDEGASVIRDDSFSTKMPSRGAYTQPIAYPSASRAYALYATHPEYFALSNSLTPYQNEVNASKRVIETISAGYLRVDTRLFKNRLWLVGGVRYERTDDDGYGPLRDPSRAPASVTDPAERNRLTFVKRGTHVKTKYDGWYPSLSAKYDVTENLVLRGGYAETLARPNFASILPGITLPDPASTSRTISLSNPNLKPWEAKNYDLTLDYYFGRIGSVGVSAFRKDIDNFFGSTSFPVDPQLLALYSIDPSIYNAANGYIMTTTLNVGAARISGLEFNYRQKMDFAFLPRWTKDIEFFASFTQNRLEGAATADFSQFSPRTYTLGMNVRHNKFSLSASMIAQGDKRMSLFTGTGAPAGTYNYQHDPQAYNLSGDYLIAHHLRIFAAAQNVGARAPVQLRFNSNTPGYARFRNLGDAQYCLITFGVKGDF